MRSSERIEQFDKIKELLPRLEWGRRRHPTLLGFVLVIDLLDLPPIDTQATGWQDMAGHLMP